MCASVYILVLSILLIGIRGQTFTSLQDGECPATSAGWKKLADARSCPGNAPYHCVINEYGEFGEVCVKESWVQPGFCPEYNTAAKKINVKRCQPFDGFSCSTQAFQSHQTYLHEICLRKPKPTTTTIAPPVTTPAPVSKGSSPVVPVVIVVLLLISVGVILFWWFYLRNKFDLEIPVPCIGRKITICSKPDTRNEDPEIRETLMQESNQDPPQGSDKDKKSGEIKIERSNLNFVETNMYRKIITMLENNKVIVVVGNIGIGKSATSIGVLEHYRDIKGWKTIHYPLDPLDKVEERTIVLVDVTFGDLSLYSRYDSNIENMMNRLYTSTRECKEYKVLITSSSSLTDLQTNFPILKGCLEFNMSYDIDDLKKLYETYTKTNPNVVNKTEDQSNEMSKSNEVVDKSNSFDKVKNATNHGDDATSSSLGKGNDKMENLITTDQKMSDKTDDDPPKSSNDPQQSLDYDMRNDTNSMGDHNKTSTEDTCNENEVHTKSTSYPDIENYCPSMQGGREDGQTDLSKVEVDIRDEHVKKEEMEKIDKLKQEAEETWKKSNVSEFGLPMVCYLPDGIKWNVSFSENRDVMSIFYEYLTRLADSKNGLDRQKYRTLVYIMLNGSTVDSRFVHKQLLSDIDQDLTPDRFLVHVTELAELGILHKRGISYSFHNDLLLFAVVHSFVSRNIRTFTAFCYLPFIWRFLRPKSSHSSDHFVVEVDADWETLCEFGSGVVKRQKHKGRHGLEDFELFKIFKKRLEYHEEGTMEFYGFTKDENDRKKRNIYVRKMINHYPELKEYYSYAEPEKFRSIPETDFKTTVKQKPPCSLDKNDFTKK